jgi:hypothetical protein
MAERPNQNKPAKGAEPAPTVEPARHPYGPRPVSALVPALIRPAFRRRAPGTAPVVADWEIIVGPALAAVTAPRKLFSGTLTIVCSGPVAMELQHLAAPLMGRINGHLGRIAVSRLRFVQDVLPVPTAVAPTPRPQAVAAARRAVATLPPGPLRDALESLGRMVLTARADPDRAS